jgi:hypothetical protein
MPKVALVGEGGVLLRKSRKQVAMAFKWINGTTSDTKLLLAYWRLRVSALLCLVHCRYLFAASSDRS